MVIKTIRNLKELESIRVIWEEMANHPNIDFEHFQLICRLRTDVLMPHVTVMERDGKVCALLIARLEDTQFVPSVGYFKPMRIPAKVLTVLYKGLLGEVDERVAKGLVRYLRLVLSSGESDAVVFNQLSEHSYLLRALLAYGPQFLCEKRPIWSTHWAMALPEEPGFLLKRMRSKHRSWIRGRYRKLEKAFPGKVSWRWMQHFDDVPALCARLERVAAHTYQRALGAGFVDNEEHRQRFALFANRRQLRAQLLEIEGRIQAFWIGTVYKGVFQSSETGYVPDLRVYEVGTLVFVKMVDELTKEGVRKLDFGPGDASYKQRFGDSSWQEATVRLFAPSVKGLVLRLVLGTSGMLELAGRRLLQKTRLVDRLKTGWRRRLADSNK